MRVDSSAFNLKNLSPSKRPKYVIVLSFDNDNTDLLYLTSDNYTETPAGATVIYNVVRDVSGQTQQINPDKGVSTIGNLSFSIVDYNQSVSDYIRTKLVAGDGLRHKRVQYSVGFDGISWSDYSPVRTFIIDDVSYMDGVYKFTASDIQRQSRKQVFDPHITQLSKTVTATDTHIPANVPDLTQFETIEHDSSYSDRPDEIVGYIELEKEIIAHTGLFLHGTDGNSFQVATNGRGALNTKAAEHVLDSTAADNRQLKITEHIFLAGAAPKVTYQILTGRLYENLLTYSEDFTNAAWTDPSAEWTVVANTDADPLSTTTADEITVTAAGDATIRVIPSPTIAGGGTYNFSVWVKVKSGSITGFEIDAAGTVVDVYEQFDTELIRVNTSIVSHATTNQLNIVIKGASVGAKLVMWGAQLSNTDFMAQYYPTTTAKALTTLPDHWNLGISTEYVKFSDYYNIGDDYWNPLTDNGRHVRFSAPKKQDGKKFLEKEIMLWLGCFMPVYSTGELGLKRLTPVLSDSGYLFEITDKSVVKYNDLKHDYKSVLNQISVEWNYLNGEFTKTTYLIDANSVSAHNDADEREIKLTGVHTGSHTDEDIISYFDTLRDRYSGPPLKLSIEVLPSLNVLEVGDTIKLNLDQIRDFNIGQTTLNRVFEVQKVSTNWINGNTKLDLFGSSQKAGTLDRTTLSTVLDDSYYGYTGTHDGAANAAVLTDTTETWVIDELVGLNIFNITDGSSSVITANTATTVTGVLTGGTDNDWDVSDIYSIGEGIDMRTVLTISGGAITANGGWTGAALVSDAIYYYLGDLTLNSSIVMTITANSFIKVMGHLTINGTIDGAGGGQTAGTGATLWHNATTEYTHRYIPPTTNATSGVPGYLGITKSAGDILLNSSFKPVGLFSKQFSGNSRTIGQAVSVGFFNITNNSTSLDGLPTDLRGTGGAGGGCAAFIAGGTYFLDGEGGAGGAGGSGLLIISRGGSFGASGSIDLSGADGSTGESATRGGYTLHSGSGGGGAPGACVWLIDGNQTSPELLTYGISAQGDSPAVGRVMSDPFLEHKNLQFDKWYTYDQGFTGFDMGSSGYSLQYIPPSETIEEEIDKPPPDVTSLTATNNEINVELSWDEIKNETIRNYTVREGTTWATGTNEIKVDSNSILIPISDPGSKDYMVKAEAFDGQESQTDTSVNITSSPLISLGSKLLGSDAIDNDSVYFHTFFVNLSKFITSGTVQLGSLKDLEVVGNAATSSIYRQIAWPTNDLTWLNSRRFKTTVVLTNASLLGATEYVNVGIGDTAFGQGSMWVEIYYTAGKTYARARSWGSTSYTGTGVDISASNKWKLEGRFTVGASVELFVDDVSIGSTTTSTDFPSDTYNTAQYVQVIKNNGTNTSIKLSLDEWQFLQEP